jgi:AAA ATPase domain
VRNQLLISHAYRFGLTSRGKWVTFLRISAAKKPEAGMSGRDAKNSEATPLTASPVAVALARTWDASLTYDLLDTEKDAERADGVPVFVGREELLGTLVNAVGRSDRRGTYLVSGYRGAGKTSLIIEAIRQANPQLTAEGSKLLPLVLNVSEVSASLEPVSIAESGPLQIDARKLLTALLRALRNEFEKRGLKGENKSELEELTKHIRWTYQKAEATRYTEKEQRGVEWVEVSLRESRRSFHVPDVLRLIGAAALVAAVAFEGIALLGFVISALQFVAAPLAGLALFSFYRSWSLTKKRTQSASGSTELVRDNSVHQLESELKDILEKLHGQHQFRTIVILEELDKIDDKQGNQLDLVIRYFKNLFTQAPALFFFLTDKAYYDLIAEKIEFARNNRTYAIEHTFFTHRLFVSRPSMEDCLEYLKKAFSLPAGFNGTRRHREVAAQSGQKTGRNVAVRAGNKSAPLSVARSFLRP